MKKKTLYDLSSNGHYVITPRFRTKLYAENGEHLSYSAQTFTNHKIALENIKQQIKANRSKKALVWDRKFNEVFWLYSDGGRVWEHIQHLELPKHR